MTILFTYLFWQSLVCYVIPDVTTLMHVCKHGLQRRT